MVVQVQLPSEEIVQMTIDKGDRIQEIFDKICRRGQLRKYDHSFKIKNLNGDEIPDVLRMMMMPIEGFLPISMICVESKGEEVSLYEDV